MRRTPPPESARRGGGLRPFSTGLNLFKCDLFPDFVELGKLVGFERRDQAELVEPAFH